MSVNGQDVEVQKVDLEPLNLIITLPITVKVSRLDNSVHLDFNPGGRQVRQCTLEVSHNDSVSGFAHATQLSKGVTLYYNLEEFEGGSGGKERVLTGLLQTAHTNYAIESHDQAEYPAKPDPRFCLTYLSSLEYTQKENNDN